MKVKDKFPNRKLFDFEELKEEVILQKDIRKKVKEQKNGVNINV